MHIILTTYGYKWIFNDVLKIATTDIIICNKMVG